MALKGVAFVLFFALTLLSAAFLSNHPLWQRGVDTLNLPRGQRQQLDALRSQLESVLGGVAKSSSASNTGGSPNDGEQAVSTEEDDGASSAMGKKILRVIIPGVWAAAPGSLDPADMSESHINSMGMLSNAGPSKSYSSEDGSTSVHIPKQSTMVATLRFKPNIPGFVEASPGEVVNAPPQQVAERAVYELIDTTKKNRGIDLAYVATHAAACKAEDSSQSNFDELAAQIINPITGIYTRNDVLSIRVEQQRDQNFLVNGGGNARAHMQCGPFFPEDYFGLEATKTVNKNAIAAAAASGNVGKKMTLPEYEVQVELEHPHLDMNVSPGEPLLIARTPIGTLGVGSNNNKVTSAREQTQHDVEESHLRLDIANWTRPGVAGGLQGLIRDFVPLMEFRLLNDRWVKSKSASAPGDGAVDLKVVDWFVRHLQCEPLPCLSPGGLDTLNPLGLLQIVKGNNGSGSAARFFRSSSDSVVQFGFPSEIFTQSPGGFHLYSLEEQQAIRLSLGLEVLEGALSTPGYESVTEGLSPTGFDRETGKAVFDHSRLEGVIPQQLLAMSTEQRAALKALNIKISRHYVISLKPMEDSGKFPSERYQHNAAKGTTDLYLTAKRHFYISKGEGVKLVIKPHTLPSPSFTFARWSGARSPHNIPSEETLTLPANCLFDSAPTSCADSEDSTQWTVSVSHPSLILFDPATLDREIPKVLNHNYRVNIIDSERRTTVEGTSLCHTPVKEEGSGEAELCFPLDDATSKVVIPKNAQALITLNLPLFKEGSVASGQLKQFLDSSFSGGGGHSVKLFLRLPPSVLDSGDVASAKHELAVMVSDSSERRQ